MNTFVRFVVYILIIIGISAIWEFIDIAMYGFSQKSAADALAAVIIANWLDDIAFGKEKSL